MASDGGRATVGRQPRDLVAGRYRIGGQLGRGGMGTVWRATDELLRRQVAVKELHLPDAGPGGIESGTRERALREARGVARIRHPHVVVVYDVVEQDGRPWIVMELVDGRSLADVLRQDGPLAPREAARVCAAVAGALRAAHDHGIQHRDVKPANVLIERDTGRVVLTDFGIARVPGSATISETGSFVGSPEYTAPERMSGCDAGPESDLWSLGALLCAAVDGHSPFRRDSIGEIVHAVAIADITPPATVGALLPVVSSLLDRDPARRMAAAEVRTVLLAYAEAGLEPPTAETPTPETPTPETPTPETPTPETPTPELPLPDLSLSGPSFSGPPPSGPSPSEPARPDPPPAAAGPSRRSRGRVAAAAAAVTVLAVVAGATAALVVTRGGDAGATTSTASTVPAAGSGPSATPAAAPLPPGFRVFSDPLGFSVSLPAGFVRDEVPPRVYYWSPDRRIRFGARHQVIDPRGPYAVMADQDAVGQKSFDGYRDGVITHTVQHGQPAALWEFTHDGSGYGRGEDGQARRTFDLCWIEGGRMYDMWLSAPVEEVEQARHTFDTARDSFRPH